MKTATMTVKGFVPVGESNADVRDMIVESCNLQDAMREHAWKRKGDAGFYDGCPVRRVTMRLTVEDA